MVSGDLSSGLCTHKANTLSTELPLGQTQVWSPSQYQCIKQCKESKWMEISVEKACKDILESKEICTNDIRQRNLNIGLRICWITVKIC